LGQHLAWITQQEWVTELYAEFRAAVRQLSEAVGEVRDRPVGTCMALIARPGVPVDVICGGPLRMDETRRAVECGRCGRRFDANDELRRLGLLVGLIGQDGTERMEAS